MLISVFVQNVVDMIVDYALWVAVLKKEFSKIIEGGRLINSHSRILVLF